MPCNDIRPQDYFNKLMLSHNIESRCNVGCEEIKISIPNVLLLFYICSLNMVKS